MGLAHAARSNPVSRQRPASARKKRLEATDPANHLISVSFRQEGGVAYGRVGNQEIALPIDTLAPYQPREIKEGNRLICDLPLREARLLAGMPTGRD